eukprot:8917788-Pyramimonas_sp.AAC.1
MSRTVYDLATLTSFSPHDTVEQGAPAGPTFALCLTADVPRLRNNSTLFYGSSCANNGKGALNTPDVPRLRNGGLSGAPSAAPRTAPARGGSSPWAAPPAGAGAGA